MKRKEENKKGCSTFVEYRQYDEEGTTYEERTASQGEGLGLCFKIA